jgi:hypothetical protein
MLAAIDPGFHTRIGVHFGLFCQTILGQGTPEQVSLVDQCDSVVGQVLGKKGNPVLQHNWVLRHD